VKYRPTLRDQEDQTKKRKRAPGAGRPRKTIAIPADQLPEQPYFTVPEVAAITGYHVRTIQARLRDGTLAGKKLGKEWHIYRDALLAK
jgi:excisionase family DNA binding protein